MTHTSLKTGRIRRRDRTRRPWRRGGGRGSRRYAEIHERIRHVMIRFRLLKELSYYGFSDHYVYTIEYSQGLGKHIENNITVKKVYTTAICKRFQILDLVTESF